MIYLDNAATTLHKPQAVVDAVVSAMQNLGNYGRATHESALNAAYTVFFTRDKLAKLFHCPKTENMVFTANSTEALNIAISGLFGPGDHIVSTDLEHNSVLRPLYRLEEAGAALSFLPADTSGRIDYDDFARLLRPETRAIVCTHASNLTGNVVDIARVGKIAGEHGLLFIVDASQTAGVFPIDMSQMHIDVLCFTGHKGLLGPQGTGGLCVGEGVAIRPFKVGGTGVKTFDKTQPSSLPEALEAGTLNGHGIAGLGAAVDYIQSVGMDEIRHKEQSLAGSFYTAVSALKDVAVYGDFTQAERAPIVTLNIGTLDSADVSFRLSEDYGIATRSGGHCAPRMHNALGTSGQGAVRFSFSCFNTEAEADTAAKAVAELASAYRAGRL
ncbi:cysteine desulfurase family protein [Sporobacter termitidis DSM 10068]|uniref:cysteine desulfurase n=1 Tax=Sporobacter termitidis DSM 10068 TaxID=1123282 RepID=A0A1M5VHA4_9FIRM|nr:aminotransferase class V-fold PLP-dependent enzyme [Sporobacter termitidis]SHH74591.1 cysteine desulfurase family protein [Sporobacter termitidis DSM 10068]